MLFGRVVVLGCSLTIWGNMLVRQLLLSCLLVLAWVGSAGAHPHVWVDCEITPVFNEKGLVGFRQSWFFDEMFSTNIVVEALGEHRENLTAKDTQAIKEYAFDNLVHFNYFTDIRVEGRVFDVKYVKDFQCTFENGVLSYSFFVPCTVTAVATPKKIAISVYDATFFTDIYLSECVSAQQAAGQPFATICEDIELHDRMLDVVYSPPRAYEVEFRLQ